MKEFDQWLESRTSFYVRYADDMLILGRTKAELTELLTEISLRLQQLHLRLNEEKTCCVSVDQGIEFLGYHFDRNGRSTPAKAQMNLASRLETMWLINKEMPLTDKLQKVIEITGGWEQYYRDPHEVTSILEYASLVYACGDNADKERQLADLRLRLVNEYQDILQYLTAFWKRSCNKFLELFEYEQYYQVPDGLTNDGIYRKDAADNAQVTENGIAGEAGEATEAQGQGARPPVEVRTRGREAPLRGDRAGRAQAGRLPCRALGQAQARLRQGLQQGLHGGGAEDCHLRLVHPQRRPDPEPRDAGVLRAQAREGLRRDRARRDVEARLPDDGVLRQGGVGGSLRAPARTCPSCRDSSSLNTFQTSSTE